MPSFYGHGKLMLTGEYLVLDGGASIAFPTRKGQFLKVEPNQSGHLHWIALDEYKKPWLEVEFDLRNLRLISATYETVEEKGDVDFPERLRDILLTCQKLNPDFLARSEGLRVFTMLEFNRQWGLGSSSTLIYTLSEWAGVDAFELLRDTFGGSGYDLACAGANSAIEFKLDGDKPIWRSLDLRFPFEDQLFFVYLNQKMNSRKGIKTYRRNIKGKNLEHSLNKLEEINTKLLNCSSVEDFEKAMNTHEQMIAGLIEEPCVKDRLFNDYPRVIKSLGAWGGDFCLATGGADERAYFQEKGYTTIIEFEEMLLL